jgi:hypothetical protein
MNVELHPIGGQIVFEFYTEGGPIVVCEVDINDRCIGDPLGGAHGEILINASNTREIRLRIANIIDGSALNPGNVGQVQLP